ncbi:hypothetical protein E2320_021516 [Naja naja]|nr:hypothetical protein E2320_021516 [Naja naja]
MRTSVNIPCFKSVLLLQELFSLELMTSMELKDEMVFLAGLKGLLPCAVRNLIRSKKLNISNTSGMAEGFMQANVIIMHKSFADDFEKFCQKYEHGISTGIVTNLKEYSEQFKDMVTFYLGCSFTFEKALQKAGIPTAVPCCDTGCFHCNLIVTMRCIPKDKLKECVQITHSMKKSHGAPVHIGSSGIKDLSSPEYGDTVQAHPGDVPVFWACGVTGIEAVINCIEDNASDNDKDLPEVYCISQDPLHYSIASTAAVKKIRSLENIIAIDPGNRGVKHLFSQDELLKSCLSLSHAKSVLITTGFPTHFNYEPPEENDGPPGAIAMAALLKAMEKNVVIVTDQRALDLNRKIIKEAVEQEILQTPVPVISYQSNSPDSALQFLCEDGNPEKPRFNHLIAIERAGMAADGNYYNARKVNIKYLVDPIDELFTAAQTLPGITTTGIGDGGNELGMGKLKEATKKHIKNGDVIACDVEADFAVVAGVANWGGYAVACGLYILNTCEIHDRYVRKAIGYPRFSKYKNWASALPSVAKEENMLKILQRHRVRSGVTASLAMEVDGLPFFDIHSNLIERLQEETLK